jgi:hypothetical protein
MNKKIYDALEDCLRAMEKGESLELALKRYPHLAVELNPLLEAARRARTLGAGDLPVSAVTRGQVRLLTRAADMRSARSPRFFRKPTWRYALISLVTVLVFVLGGNGLLIASAKSLPGDPLYSFKRSVEWTQLILLFDPARRQALQVAFSQRRVDETRSLITGSRVEPVEFDGVVASQTDDGWLVSGIPVVVTSQTQVDGNLQIGDKITVSGETSADGRVDATHLIPVSDDSEHPSESTVAATGTRIPLGTHEFEYSSTGAFEQGTPQPTGYHWDPTGGGEGQRTPEPTGTQWSGDGPDGTTTPTPTPRPTEGGDDWHH